METEAAAQLLNIGIVGTALSMGIQWLQNKYGVEGTTTRIISVVGSVVLGAFVWVFQDTAIWASIIGVLASASTMYALVFSGARKEEKLDREDV